MTDASNAANEATDSDSTGETQAAFICPLCGLEDDVQLQMDKHVLSAHSLDDRVSYILSAADTTPPEDEQGDTSQ